MYEGIRRCRYLLFVKAEEARGSSKVEALGNGTFNDTRFTRQQDMTITPQLQYPDHFTQYLLFIDCKWRMNYSMPATARVLRDTPEADIQVSRRT